MKLNKIEADNIKGRSFKIQLAPVTALIGASFSGKTAILDAIRIGLLGYHPKLGKRPMDTMKLADGNEMEVKLRFDDARLIERRWTMVNGSARVVGSTQVEVPPALLDVREYFGMSGPERMRYVFAQIDASKDLTEALVISHVRNCIVPEMGDAEAELAIAEAVKIVAALSAAREEESATVQEWVDAILKEFTEKKKAADVAAKQFAGLTQGASQLRASGFHGTNPPGFEPTAFPPRNVEAALEEARERVTVLRTELSGLLAAREAANKTANRIAYLEGQTVSDTSERVANLRAEVTALEEECAGEAPDTDGARLTMIRRENDLAIEKTTIAQLRDEAKKLVAKHKETMAKKCCPFCKTQKTGWQASIIAEYNDALDKNQTALVAAEKRALNLDTEYRVAKKAFDKIQKADAARDAAQASLNQKRKLTDVLEADARQSAAMKTELELLRKTPEHHPVKSIADKEAEIRGAIDHAGVLDGHQRRYLMVKATEAQSLKANAAHALQRARVEVYKAVLVAVRNLQQEMIDRAVGGLLDVANKFTSGILKGALAYRDGDIGYWDGCQWVTHECFSGTETALAYAALSVALAQQSPFKLVMIDELGIADMVTKGLIIERMVELEKAGVIDQCIACDVDGDLVGIEGVTIERIE